MEIKAELKKPYTDEQRIKFIVENNHKKGYTIEESANSLVALGGTEEEKAEKRKQEFEIQFFEIPNVGYFRKKPKGYGSAVESLNTAFNMVTVMGMLPANTLTFYSQPDFTDETQCTEEWLIENSFKNAQMTIEEFGKFYASFLTAWNNQEHL